MPAISAGSIEFWRRRLVPVRGQRGKFASAMKQIRDVRSRRADIDNLPEKIEAQLLGEAAPFSQPSSGYDVESDPSWSPGHLLAFSDVSVEENETAQQRTAFEFVSGAGIRTFDGLMQLVRYDTLQVVLRTREKLWNSILNRHLYAMSGPSVFLLISSVFLFAVGSFWGGLVIFLGAIYWRKRADG